VLLPDHFSLENITTSRTSRDLAVSLTQRGPMLITKHGISGPVVLKLSSFGAEVLFQLNYKSASTFYFDTSLFLIFFYFDLRVKLLVNWLGDMHSDDVYDMLLFEKAQHPKRCEIFETQLNSSITPFIVTHSTGRLGRDFLQFLLIISSF
jgi:hypothetical protein